MNAKTEKVLKELLTGLISELENKEHDNLTSLLRDTEKIHLKYDDLNENQKKAYCNVAFSKYVAEGLIMLSFLNDLFKETVDDEIFDEMMEVVNSVFNDYTTTVNLDYDLAFLKRIK
jgi:hypothetical protein